MGGSLGPPEGPKMVPKVWFQRLQTQFVPKKAPRAPKRPQKDPKRGPRGPQKGPKRVPRGLQNVIT